MHLYLRCYIARIKTQRIRRALEIPSDAQLLIHLGAKSLDLSWQVDNFKRLCMGWEKHDPELNALNVIHTKKSVSTLVRSGSVQM